MAKAKMLEITLSVMGAGEQEYPGASASSDNLVISVRIRGAKKFARWRRAKVRPA